MSGGRLDNIAKYLEVGRVGFIEGNPDIIKRLVHMEGGEEKKKVPIITCEFHSMGSRASTRNAEFANSIPCFEWEPAVVTVEDIPTGIPDSGFLDELPEGLEILGCYFIEPDQMVRIINKIDCIASVNPI